MGKMPAGWVSSIVDDVANKIHYGYTGKTIENGQFRYLRITDIQNSAVKWEQVPFVSIAEKDVERYLLNENDIVFARTGATAGKSFLINSLNVNSVFASYLIRIIPDLDKIYPRFLYQYFQSPEYWSYIISNVEGAAQPNFNGKKLANIPIPLPPLPEQKRIVSELDAMFARIDKSIALLEENIKQTEHLMESALDEVFSSVPVEKYLPILDVCSIANKSIIPIGNESYNYVGLENIESQTGRLAEFSKTNGNEIKSSKVVFRKGAVLYGKLRPYLNKVYIADFDGICTTEILPFYPNNEILYKEYLAFYLRSEKFVNEVNNNTSGARMPRATTTFFKNVAKIPVPTLATQKMDVDKLTSLSTRIFLLQAEQQAKLNNLKALKESILDKAFKGEL